METIQPRPSRDTIVSGVPATSSPTPTGETAHNPADFRAFLDHLDGLHTFQTFDDKKQDKALARIIHNATPEQLRDLNQRGAGVFVMINEGDGQGRERKNVVRVRGFFADFDGADLPEQWPLEPSIITETSPGKYHAYWLLAEGQTAPLDNDAFNQQQEAIARSVGAQIPDCKGLNRVMRVPGFQHHKGEKSFTSRILSVSGLRYDLADITTAFPVQAPAAPQPRPALVSPVTSREKPTTRQATQRKYALSAMQEECNNLANTTKGNRNNTLNATAYRVGRLVGGGHLDMEEARAALLDAARACGLRDHEITATLDSGFYGGVGNPEHLDHVGTRAGQRTSSSAPAVGQIIVEHLDDKPSAYAYVMPPMPEGVQEGTDVANAVILSANQLQDRMRYTDTLGWLLYNPKRGVWEANTDLAVCAATAGQILRGAVGLHLAQTVERGAGKEAIEKALRWAKSVCNDAPVRTALSVAQGMPEFRAPIDLWDAQADLLNCTNGVLELKTGILRPHSPYDYLTIQSGAAYDPNATHPAVEQLIQWLDQDGKAEFLQRSAGSALYGANPNEFLTVLQGEGGSGKGTFCDAVKAVLGGYGYTLEVSMLLASNYGETSTGAKPELLALRKKRLVIAGEPPKGGRFNAGRVKGMTGNDAITARGMRSDVMVTFKPVFKLWMHSNYAVTADHDDSGMQRRLKVVPFTKKPNKADPHFKDTLQTDPAALSALLNWMYAGFQAWLTSGYDLASSTVDKATGHYWQSQDIYGGFAADVLEFDPHAEITSAQLKSAFENWLEEQGGRSGRDANIRDLQTYLTNRGCTRARGSQGVRKWTGVGLA